MNTLEERIERIHYYEPLFNQYYLKEVVNAYKDIIIFKAQDNLENHEVLIKMVTFECSEDEIDHKKYQLFDNYDITEHDLGPFEAYEQYYIEEDHVLGADLLFISKYGYVDQEDMDDYNYAYQYLKGLDCILDEYLAVDLLKQGCEVHNAKCECTLGYCLEAGLGIEENLEEAVECYHLAADDGEVNAMFNYGNCLLSGRGCKQNEEEGIKYLKRAVSNEMYRAYLSLGDHAYANKQYKEAFHYYQLAKEAGFSDGTYLVGMYYEHGIGVDKDIQKALENYRESAQDGNGDALLRLGYLYEEGKEVKQDLSKAIACYKEAVENCDKMVGYVFLGNLYYYGNGVEKNLELAHQYYKMAANYNLPQAEYRLYWLEKDQNTKSAIKHLKRAAELSYGPAYLRLGYIYQEGLEGFVQDNHLAFENYYSAYREGNDHAYFSVGYCYERGLGVEQSYQEAAKFYLLGCEVNDPRCFNSIGYLYENGIGVNQNNQKAFDYYTKSCQLDYPQGIYNYASCLEDGIGCTKDFSKALIYYKKAAGFDMPRALYRLAVLYEFGEGVEQDEERAFHYYQRCSDLHFLAGITSLGVCYEKGIGTAQDLEKAKELYLEAMKENYPRAYYCYGLLMLYNEKNKDGVSYLEKAIELNDDKAALFLGNLYEKGEYVTKDENKAIEYYQLAHNSEGYYRIGRIYRKKDLNKAIEYYKKATNDQRAMFELGLIYYKLENYKEAKVYYDRLIEKYHHIGAMNNLALMYEKGQGVLQNVIKARNLLLQACKEGSSRAAYNLAVAYLHGTYGKQDLDLAEKYLIRAKESGEEVETLEKEIKNEKNKISYKLKHLIK